MDGNDNNGNGDSGDDDINNLAGNVADMLATCCHGSLSVLLADIALLWQHKSDHDTYLCVGDCQHSPLSS
jgi:hypothetical protein